MTKPEDEMEEITLKVRAVIREARETYDRSYGFAKQVLDIEEIAEGLKLYLRRKYADTSPEQ